MAWSPLAGGLLGDGAGRLLHSQQACETASVVAALDEIAKQRGATHSAIALAWLLRHPSRSVPIAGSTNPVRIRDATRATEVELAREEWYRLLEAARGEPVP